MTQDEKDQKLWQDYLDECLLLGHQPHRESFLAGLAVGRTGERDGWLAGLVRETHRTERSDRFIVDTPDEYDPVFFPDRAMAEEFATKTWFKPRES